MCTKYGSKKIHNFIQKYPELDLKGQTGETDYIDFLTWEDIDHPIMWGIDRFNRLFFVIKGYVNGKKVLQTFFQRYSGILSVWTSAGNYHFKLLDTGGGVCDEQFDFLFDLIQNKKANIGFNTRINEYLFSKQKITKEIKLYTAKLESSILIQKTWRKCRDNQIYKMCEKVLMNNINEVHKEYNYKSIV